MKIAYLVLAHNTPNHLKRLIQSLSSGSSSFFIHLDKKSNYEDFLSIEAENVHFTKERIPVFWGDYSQVEAIVVLLKNAFENKIKFDRFVLLSGADYPLRQAAYIEAFFKENKGKEYISMVEMPSLSAGKPISRLTTYKLRPGDRHFINFVKKILMNLKIWPRKRDHTKYLINLTPYGGSTWWALTRNAVDYILSFITSRPRVVNFFKNTVCPDEVFFQTILGNSDFKNNIKRSVTYADWSQGGPNPATISEKHIEYFKTTLAFSADGVFGGGELLFARKFPDSSENLVSMLRQQIHEHVDGPSR